ncbi:MAG: serpin family protein [Micromonosporaceae bacterium]|nr:serpin family protein [Micromonosporaceae bacterium]
MVGLLSVSRIAATLLVGSLLVAGCAAPDDGGGGPEPEPSPALVGLETELAGEADARAVGDSVNEFGFELLGEVTAGDENAVTSPVSVATLLAMVLAGAGGDTATAMAEVLHLDDSRDVRAGALLDTLTDTDQVELSVANAIWGDDQVPFEPDYVSFVRDTFGATHETADLATPATAEAVDAWVREQTEDRIDGIAADLGMPDPDLAMVLLNAVYFLGQWTTEFDPADTLEQPFTLASGEQVPVPLMQLREQELAYAERDGYRMLRLPYGQDGRYGMEVLLPDPEADLAGLLAELDAAEWRSAVDSLTEQTVDNLALPRFTLEWGEPLNEPLDRLGLGPAMDPGAADFAPMSPADLFLDVVVHKTFIAVDEAGTEAAAVTGGGMGVTSAQPQTTFRVDRPFAFTISDSQTGTVLFLGAVADPRG